MHSQGGEDLLARLAQKSLHDIAFIVLWSKIKP